MIISFTSFTNLLFVYRQTCRFDAKTTKNQPFLTGSWWSIPDSNRWPLQCESTQKSTSIIGRKNLEQIHSVPILCSISFTSANKISSFFHLSILQTASKHLLFKFEATSKHLRSIFLTSFRPCGRLIWLPQGFLLFLWYIDLCVPLKRQVKI